MKKKNIFNSVYWVYTPAPNLSHFQICRHPPPLKPTNPASDSGSYRPISLTSVISKVAERMMDSRIRADPACPIDPRQNAFRRGHRTENALAQLVDTANRA